MTKFFLVTFLSLFFSFNFAQNSFKINGKVIEKTTSIPMEYSTIAVYSKDSSMIDGTVTNSLGIFTLNVLSEGVYYIKISYLGFKTKTITDLILNKENRVLTLENVYLESDGEKIEGVNVVREKSTIRYEMDKKIIDVGKDIASSNGSAVDVLENVSAVDVDIQGNVKLRGSDNFMVLIDGKPTVLSGKEALQQIPASNIKNIELITNPSAKYEAGNTGGIINIILKEQKKIGTSGMISLGLGTFNNHNARVSLKHNVKKFSFNFSASTYQSNHPSKEIQEVKTSSFDIVNITNTEELRIWKFKGYNFKYGIEYRIIKDHSLNFNILVGKWGMNVTGDEDVHSINETYNTEEYYSFNNNQDRYSKYFGPSLSYQGSFKNKSSLSAYVGYSQRDFREKVLDTKYSTLDIIEFKAKSTEIGFRQSIKAKLDYTLPIKEGKLELGGKIRSAWNNEITSEYDYDLDTEKYNILNYNNKNISYAQEVYGLYATYGNSWKKLSYSIGFRAEYIDRNIKMKEDNLDFNYYKWDYFPSASLGYKLSDKSKIYASFSKRIRRFHSYMLEPIAIKTGANSYFKGNPDLKPEMINSSEIGWSNTFKKNSTLSIEIYHKYKTNVNRWFTSIYEDSVSIISQPLNIGISHDLGLETNFNFKPLKWWSIDLMGSGFYKIDDGQFGNIDFANKSFNWKARFNNNFTIAKNTKIQFTGNYRSRTKTAIYIGSPSINFGLGIKQSFFKKALSITADIDNIFFTKKHNGITSYENYYSTYESITLWPFINFGLSYKINNYRQSRSESERGGQGEF